MRNISGAAVVLLAAVAVPSLAQQGAPPSAQVRPPEVIFAKVCGYCHTTRVGPVLTGRDLPPDYIVATVRAGRNGMPAFRQSEISNAELAALARWIERNKTPAEGGTQ